MYKVQKFLWFLAYIYVSFIFRKKDVYVVNGLRRSGNHAFINWFTNALEKKPTTYEVLQGNVSQTSNGRTIFFNEVNFFGIMTFISMIRLQKSMIAKSSFIIISLEDYVSNNITPFIPKNAKKISITRSSLNIIASRLHKQIELAKSGYSRGDMSIDAAFFNRLNWIHNSENLGWLIWNYDSWLQNDNNYRKHFLNSFQLTFDLSPEMSKEGGGSSFTGRKNNPDIAQLISRWKKVEWPGRVLDLFLKDNNKETLTRNEKSFVEEKIANSKLKE